MKNVIISLTTGCRDQDIVSKTFAINKDHFDLFLERIFKRQN
jgi:hypothetical protein